jgi:hypothetical protein
MLGLSGGWVYFASAHLRVLFLAKLASTEWCHLLNNKKDLTMKVCATILGCVGFTVFPNRSFSGAPKLL